MKSPLRYWVVALIAVASCQTCQAKGGTRPLTINIPNIEESYNSPLERLSDAVLRNPKHARFRVYWYLLATSVSAALYNRPRHTIDYRSFHYWEGGKDYTHVLFTGVTDSMIHRAAKEHLNIQSSGGRYEYFETLLQYGAKCHNLPYGPIDKLP